MNSLATTKGSKQSGQVTINGATPCISGEIWSDIQGYEGHYQVSNLGRIKSLDRTVLRTNNSPQPRKGKILKLTNSVKGYFQTQLCRGGKRKTKVLHRIIAETFLIRVKDHNEINHKNGIKNDNRIENLEWSTRSKNMKHAFHIGLISNKGKNNANVKLTEKQVLEIRSLEGKYLLREIGKMYNVDLQTIHKIIKRKSWNHLK